MPGETLVDHRTNTATIAAKPSATSSRTWRRGDGRHSSSAIGIPTSVTTAFVSRVSIQHVARIVVPTIHAVRPRSRSREHSSTSAAARSASSESLIDSDRMAEPYPSRNGSSTMMAPATSATTRARVVFRLATSAPVKHSHETSESHC